MSLLFLIGMPASGKSYWAKKLATQYGLSLIDLDNYIEEKESKGIQALFELMGEDEFRELETAALDEIISKSPANTVVASGGGTPVYHNNMDKMLSNGVVVYLSAGMDTLAQRLENEEDKRPLFSRSQDFKKVLEKLWLDRKNIYERAHYILAVENLSITNFDKIILDV